jgi:tetratricopeptide (TPR) repeat protein
LRYLRLFRVSRLVRAAAWLALALSAAATASAQGRVAGVVKDAQGHAIKGATVTAENAGYPSVTVISDNKGRYGFLGLRGGEWTFTAEAPRFLEAKRQLTTRALGPNPSIDFALDPSTDLSPRGPLANLDARALEQQIDAAEALEKSARLDEAIAAYRDILARVPVLTSVHLELGVLLERTGDRAAAATEYQAALQADPGSARARSGLDRVTRQ